MKELKFSMESASIARSSLQGKIFFCMILDFTHLGKLRSRWTRPFIVMKIFPYSAIEIKDPTKDHTFEVNGHRLKHFLDIYA